MRKLSRSEDDPLLSHLRRGMSRPSWRRGLYSVAFLLIFFLIYRWFIRQPYSNPEFGYRAEIMAPPGVPAKPKLNSVNLEIYLESQCPDTSRFMHKQLMRAWEMLGHTGRIELTLVPFGKARCIEKDDDFECSCQHGSNECLLNQLMNCVIDRVGFPEKIVPIVNCIQGKRDMDSAISQCIANNSLLNENQTRECATGARGRRLLALSGSRTVGLRPSMTFVPWIMIDGERNTDAIYDLAENLCKKLEPAPKECAIYGQPTA